MHTNQTPGISCAYFGHVYRTSTVSEYTRDDASGNTKVSETIFVAATATLRPLSAFSCVSGLVHHRFVHR